MHTEVGNIAGMLNSVEETATPLQQKLNKLGKSLGIMAIVICIVIFIIGLAYGKDVWPICVVFKTDDRSSLLFFMIITVDSLHTFPGFIHRITNEKGCDHHVRDLRNHRAFGRTGSHS